MPTPVPPENIRLKRAYAAPAPEDGARILVDRLWPRGVSKTQAAIGRWMKEIAPSTGLRKWYHQGPPRWDEFRRRYLEELQQHAPLLEELRALARRQPVTLVYAARDEERNHATILRELILSS